MIYDLFEDDEGRQFLWAHCIVAGSQNQVCLGRSDRFCWPHSQADMTFEQIMQIGKKELSHND